MYRLETGNVELDTCIVLRQAQASVERLIQERLDKLGTTVPQFEVLSILKAQGGPLTPGDISDITGNKQHSVSALLSRMRDDKLVTKTRSSKDQRVVKISATREGLALVDRVVDVLVEVVAVPFMGFPGISGLKVDLESVRDAALVCLEGKVAETPTGKPDYTKVLR